MPETLELTTVQKIRIDGTDVFLDVMGDEQGKITVSDTMWHNYSYYWGAMGGGLHNFLTQINKEYFASKLMGSRNDNTFDPKRTFANVRKFIEKEFDLPWYKHQEFQKQMRECLNSFQELCEERGDEQYFVHLFDSQVIMNLEFWRIKDEWDRKEVESNFKSMSEIWHFIETKPSKEYEWLIGFHGKLKKKLVQMAKN